MCDASWLSDSTLISRLINFSLDLPHFKSTYFPFAFFHWTLTDLFTALLLNLSSSTHFFFLPPVLRFPQICEVTVNIWFKHRKISNSQICFSSLSFPKSHMMLAQKTDEIITSLPQVMIHYSHKSKEAEGNLKWCLDYKERKWKSELSPTLRQKLME